MNTLILTNDKGAVHITKCDTRSDAFKKVAWIEKNYEQVIASAIIVYPDGARNQIRGGTF